jgi:hypothetical protein
MCVPQSRLEGDRVVVLGCRSSEIVQQRIGGSKFRDVGMKMEAAKLAEVRTKQDEFILFSEQRSLLNPIEITTVLIVYFVTPNSLSTQLDVMPRLRRLMSAAPCSEAVMYPCMNLH